MSKKLFLLVLIFSLAVFLTASRSSKAEVTLTSFGSLVLPETSAWVNLGIAISEGAEGEWDRYLWGGFAESLVKKHGVYYLYYQGSSSFSDTCNDNTYRQIGVATSTDGINWTKYAGNPVITWTDQGAVTEGAVSSGAVLGADGNIYLYYGANSAYDQCLVHAAGRLAQSSDGINFTDVGEVIHNASPLWGFGDEIFPVGVYENGGSWNVFYIPNGVSKYANKKLGVITGSSLTGLDPNQSRGVNGGLPAWGPVSIVSDSSAAYAFVNDPATNRPVKVYSFAPGFPSSMTLRKTYVFSDCMQASVLYEPEMSRWLMLCRDVPDNAFYRVKVAPVVFATPSPTGGPVPTIGPSSTSSPKSTPPSSSPTPWPTGTK